MKKQVTQWVTDVFPTAFVTTMEHRGSDIGYADSTRYTFFIGFVNNDNNIEYIKSLQSC